MNYEIIEQIKKILNSTVPEKATENTNYDRASLSCAVCVTRDNLIKICFDVIRRFYDIGNVVFFLSMDMTRIVNYTVNSKSYPKVSLRLALSALLECINDGELNFRPSSSCSLSLLETLNKTAPHVKASLESGKKNIELTPILIMSKDSELQLAARIKEKDSSHKYIVKDLIHFYDNINKNATVSYGKNLSFIHSRESFTDESMPFFNFLTSICDRTKNVLSNISFYSASNKCISLTNAETHDLMSICGTVELGEYNGKPLYKKLCPSAMFTFIDGDPKLEVTITKTEYGTHLSCDEFAYVSTSDSLYILVDSKMYITTFDYTYDLKSFFSSLFNSDFHFFFSNDDLPDLCMYIYPLLYKYFTIIGDTDALSEHMPDIPEFELYLDLYNDYTISAYLRACYKDISINLNMMKMQNKLVIIPKDRNMSRKAVLSTAESIKRDTRSENEVYAAVNSFFNFENTNEALLMYSSEEEQLYDFINSTVPLMSKYATLFISASIKKLTPSPAPKISIGVNIEHDLLDLVIDSGSFSKEELLSALSSYKAKKKYYKLKDGSLMCLSDNTFQPLLDIMDDLALTDKDMLAGKISLPRYRALYIDRMLNENASFTFDKDKAFRNLIKGLKSVEDNEYDIPASLKGVLRNYQKTGFCWIRTLEHFGFGGILADDMGLGKTLQMLAAIISLKGESKYKTSLVVCPTSLVLNWKNEVEKFSKEITVLPVMGDAAQRKELIGHIPDYDIAVTSYELLKRDIELYKNITFNYHIIDEAQQIKNQNTQNAKSNKIIKSEHRFALTGTPIENNLSELWSIFDFLMPGFLYSYTKFKKKIELPIVKNGEASSLILLSKLSNPFILRRLKKDVLKELPPKIETVNYSEMYSEQLKLYEANLLALKMSLSKDKEEYNTHKIEILAMLTKLRQICCDPTLLYSDYDKGSSKLDSCIDLISDAKSNGHKILLFSQFTSMLDIIQRRLNENSISYYRLDGSTSKQERSRLVEKFNSDNTSVFLISLRAGGTGLNLTGADTVIHYDPWWNISVQNQATDRAHRIGQTNTVTVYKLIAKGTIEEKIIELQEKKRDLADSVIHEGESLLTKMSADELLSFLD